MDVDRNLAIGDPTNRDGRDRRAIGGRGRLSAGWVVGRVGCSIGIAGGLLALPMSQPALAQQIADPAYMNPTTDPSDWTELIDSTPGAVQFAVANVSDGPGSAADPAWASVIQRASTAGIKVLGYVDTGYFGTSTPPYSTKSGATSESAWLSQIEQQVDSWYSYYGSDIAGIFFDNESTKCNYESLYQTVDTYVKDDHPGAVVVENPGTAVPQCYEPAADVTVTFEGTFQDYTSSPSTDPNAYEPLDWTSVSPGQEWHVIYDTSQADLGVAVSIAASRGAGYVYVTNLTAPNPYTALPPSSYWTQEQSLVAGSAK